MSALEPISMQAVSEKVVLARKGRLEEDAQFVVNPRLSSTEFIPLEERMAGEKPEIAACLGKLKEHLKDIMDAFSVDNVRIVGGAGFGGIDAF